MRDFWSKVDKRGTETHPFCWVWTAAIDRGYGRFSPTGKKVCLAHRIAYSLLIEEPPKGLDLDHLCRNRRCVNPVHLEPVPRRVNIARGQNFAALNMRKTHCLKGHPFDEANTYRPARGGRECRACRAIVSSHLHTKRLALKSLARAER